MTNKKALSILFLALILTSAFEIYNLTKISLWHDEAFSALLIKYDFGEMIYRIGLDVHPPFYYIVLRGWDSLFGNSLFSLRAFSVFFSILMVLAAYLLVKEAFRNRKLALFSSLLLAFSSFQIQYAMEARMYVLGTFLIILSSYFILKALKTKNWSWWLLYALAVSAGIYTHYYVFFSVLAQGIFLLCWVFKESRFSLAAWLKNKTLWLASGAYGLVALFYLPWLNIFLRQLGQVQESYWIPPMGPLSVPNTFFKMTTGGQIDQYRFWYISIALMILILIAAVYALRKIKPSAKWLIFLSLVIPFIAAIGLSLKTSIYLDRYFIFVLPFYLILMGGAVFLIKNKQIRNTLIGLAVLGSMATFPMHWSNLNADKKPGMAAAAAYLNQEVKPDNRIYIGSSFVYFTFKYYNKTEVCPRLYAPNPLSHFSGTALLSPQDTIKDFSQEVVKNDVVWLINTTGFGNYQPFPPDNWVKKEEKGFQDVYDYQGWIIVSRYRVQ